VIAGVTRFVLRHPRAVTLFWLIVTVAGLASAGSAVKALSDQFSVPGREGYETNLQITRTFGSGGDSAPLVAVVTLPAGESVDAPAVKGQVARVAGRIEAAVPHVRIASYASTGDRAFVSRDGHTTFVLAYPPPKPGSFGQNPQAVNAADAALRGVTVAGSPVRLTGLGPLSASSGQKGGAGLLAEGLLGGLGALAVLAFVFASLLAIVPLIMAVISIMTTFLLVWGLTAITPVSGMVAFLIALVGLGVAIDYSLLIIVRWREERAQGQQLDDAAAARSSEPGGQAGGDAAEEAIVRAMATAGRAVVFSGSTVAIGLLGLTVLPLPFLRSVGYAGLLIPLVSVAVAVTLLPIILLKLGSRLDWPHVRSDERASPAWTRWATLVVHRRWIAAGVAVTLLAVLVVAASTIKLGPTTGDPNTLATTGEAKAGLTELERSGIGDGALSPTEILTHGSDPQLVSQRLNTIPRVQGATAPSTPGWRIGGVALVDVLAHTDSASTVDRIRAAHPLGADVRVGGIVAQNSDFIHAVYGSFPVMIALIALLTFMLLARAFRSLLLPAKAVILNVLSVAAAWGVVTLVWQDGHGSDAIWGIPAGGSIPSWLPLIVFAFLFGLSMDYEVFILARMREEYDTTGSTDTAVVRGIGRTGRLVTSAALIMFLGFVAMATAPSTQVKMIATGLGAGIILDATVVRALLVPAAVALFGRFNWWLPHRVARVLRVSPSPPPPQTPAALEEGVRMSVELRIAALMGLEAASLAAMSSLHLTGTLAGGVKPFQPSQAGIAEALICLVLTAGSVTLARARSARRGVALVAVAFAILGFIVGLNFTIQGGDAIDIAYHATVLPLLLVTLLLLVVLRGARCRAASAARGS
jgi:RND superfamily putative drug exporter